jgi:hypothetical protein
MSEGEKMIWAVGYADAMRTMTAAGVVEVDRAIIQACAWVEHARRRADSQLLGPAERAMLDDMIGDGE